MTGTVGADLAHAPARTGGPPVINVQPVDRTAEEGDYVWQDHSVSGGTPMTFRWFREGAELRGLQTYNGGYSVFLTLDARLGDTGDYWYVASNASGSVTSRVVRLTVRSAPPNPERGGRRFARRVSAGSTPQGALVPFSVPAPRAPVRWSQGAFLFSGQAADGSPMGILEADRDRFRVRLPLGGPLPEGLGILGELGLPQGAGSGDPLLVLARVEGTPFPSAILRVDGDSSMVPLVDRRTVVPGAEGEVFSRLIPFSGRAPAVQKGARLVFAAETASRSGAYLWEQGQVRRLLDSTQSLPGIAAGQRRHLMQVAFDGRLAATAWESESGLGFLGLWVLDVDAGTPPVQVVIDRFPDGSPGFFGLDALVVHDGAIYFNAGNASGYASVHRWKEGVVTTLLGDTHLVEAAGGMFGVDPFNLHVDQGGVFAYAFMNGDNARIPVVAETDGKVNWLLARKIDGHRAKYQFGGAMVLGASEGRIAAWVPFENAGPAPGIYINSDPVLHATRSEGGRLRLELPARTLLQRAGTPDGPWSESSEGNEAPANARAVEVRPDGPAAYFRLIDTTDQ